MYTVLLAQGQPCRPKGGMGGILGGGISPTSLLARLQQRGLTVSNLQGCTFMFRSDQNDSTMSWTLVRHRSSYAVHVVRYGYYTPSIFHWLFFFQLFETQKQTLTSCSIWTAGCDVELICQFSVRDA